MKAPKKQLKVSLPYRYEEATEKYMANHPGVYKKPTYLVQAALDEFFKKRGVSLESSSEGLSEEDLKTLRNLASYLREGNSFKESASSATAKSPYLNLVMDC